MTRPAWSVPRAVCVFSLTTTNEWAYVAAERHEHAGRPAEAIVELTVSAERHETVKYQLTAEQADQLAAQLTGTAQD